MLHLLIDTSTIKSDLISKKKFSTSLIRLEELVKNYGVKILFPQSLQKEWEDHKEKEYKALQKKLNQDKDLLNKINLPNFPAVKNGFEKYEKLMISQIDKFDELLDSAIKIEISDQVKVKTSDHQYNDLAPFKHKKNSVKDAFTIFSAMDFCELNDIHDFFMVSGDVNDFTNQDSQNLKIHDDISNGRSVEINFYENIRDFFDEVEREFDIEFDTDPKYQVSSSDSSESADIILTDQNQPINQQLTQIAQSELFKTLNFIPHHIILKIVPFKSSDRTLFRNFNLETQNQELFDFFSPLGIKEWDSSKTDFKVKPKKVDSEITEVANRMSDNAIFFIAKNKEYIRISRDIRELCDCPTCRIKRLDFTAIPETNPKFDSEKSDIQDLLKFAYANYKIDNLETAAELTIRALKESRKGGKENTIGQFLSYYNLSVLNNLMRNRSVYKDFYSQHEEILKTSKDEMESLHLKSKYGNNHKIFEWLWDDKFYNSSFQQLSKLVYSVRKIHFNSIGNSRSYNSLSQDLTYHYAMSELFVQSNYLMFDEFLEFSNLTQLFAEGMYLSLGTEGDNSQLSAFNDWTVKILIKHAKADDLIEFFKLAKLRKVTYKPSSTLAEDSAIEMILRLFENANSAIESMDEFGEKSSFFLLQSRHLYSALVLAGQCDFQENDLIKLINLIPNLLNQRRMRVTIKYVEYFMIRKKHLISGDIYKKIWIAMFNNPELHWGNFSTLAIIANCIDEEGLKLKLSKEEFELNISFVMDYCENCSQIHKEFDALIHLCRITDDSEQKERLLALIKVRLDNKDEEFNIRLLELAVVYDLFELSEDHLNQIILESEKEIKAIPKKISEWDTFPILMNICFKYDFDLSSEKFNPLRNLNPFSDWLLDFNNFSYDQFSIDWMFEIRTSYSQKKMKESKQLRRKLEEIISSKDPTYSKRKIEKLEKVYLNIYV